ncbi:MAG TPA: DinB family protein [Gemmatimonadaceae bacterium]|nr:DinB family protein [Gemmatimonadaceae bacterium]
MPITTRPAETEYAPFYAGYVARVPDGDVVDLLRAQLGETLALLRAVPEERGGYRYGEGKWSIKEVVGHMADTERIMCYRALRVARGDRTPLPGFDEKEYVKHAGFDRRSLASLLAEFEQVRIASIAFFETLTPEDQARVGVANDRDVTARALAYIVAGHERHHVAILRERYLESGD